MQSNDELANLVNDFKEPVESYGTIEKIRELEEKRNRINLILLKDKGAKLSSEYWNWNERSIIYLQALQNHVFTQERYEDMVRSCKALAEVIDSN